MAPIVNQLKMLFALFAQPNAMVPYNTKKKEAERKEERKKGRNKERKEGIKE